MIQIYKSLMLCNEHYKLLIMDASILYIYKIVYRLKKKVMVLAIKKGS